MESRNGEVAAVAVTREVAADNASASDLEVQTLEPNRVLLLNKIDRLQRTNVRLMEKIDFMQEHIGQLTQELQKKSQILQVRPASFHFLDLDVASYSLIVSYLACSLSRVQFVNACFRNAYVGNEECLFIIIRFQFVRRSWDYTKSSQVCAAGRMSSELTYRLPP